MYYFVVNMLEVISRLNLATLFSKFYDTHGKHLIESYNNPEHYTRLLFQDHSLWVVNCTKWELQFFDAPNTPDLQVYQVPVEDSASDAPEIAGHFEPAASFIEQGVTK